MILNAICDETEEAANPGVDLLISENFDLIEGLVWKYCHNGDYADYRSMAMDALLKAAQCWDGRVPFRAFATKKIKWRFADERRRVIRPVHGGDCQFLSLDFEWGDTEAKLQDFLFDDNAIVGGAAMVSEEAASAVRRAMLQLPARSQHCLELFYGFDNYDRHTLDEIGDKYGVTGSRISQLLLEAVKQLRFLIEVEFGK